jgi:uncharacterized membrane protein
MLRSVEADRARRVERLVTFADAVVAIAITLLALPLVDDIREHAGEPLPDILGAVALPFLAFAISFFVLARLWWAHHRIFEHVVRGDGVLVQLTILWLFSIVVLAPLTSLTAGSDPTDPSGRNAGVVALYLGTMTLSSMLLTGMAWRVHARPELTDGHDVDAGRRLFGSAETTIAFVVAFAIGTAVPAINYFALLVLVVAGQVGRLVWNRRQRSGTPIADPTDLR